MLQEEPIADNQIASVDACQIDGTKYGDAPRCEVCKRYIGMRAWLPPYRVELETWGYEFADIVVIGTNLLISQRFKQAWEQSQLVGLSGFENVEVINVKRHRKKIGEPPTYFRAVVVRGQTAINLVASEFEWKNESACPVCRLAGVIKRWKRIIIDQSTWTGEDIFIARGLPGEICVSERFKDFCEINNMKNTLFVAAETYGHDFYPWEK